MSFKRAERLEQLPPYLFIEIDRAKRAAMAAGRDVIDLGVGDPDRPTFDFIIDAMAEAIRDPATHRYPHDAGVPAFKEAVAVWFEGRFGVKLDPASEILTLIGSKEGLGHLPLAVVNPGQVGLVPRPGYPVYHSATIFAGGEPHIMSLSAERGWLPDLQAIPIDVLDRAAIMFLNYPNNPIGATANLDFYREAVALAHKHDFIIAHDMAYSEVYFDVPPPSILQIDGAKAVSVELHSLSKTFNMTGWRLAFAVGHAEVLAALAKIKGNVDSGQFNAIQRAGVAAMKRIDGPEVNGMRALYRGRRDRFVAGLRKAGFDAPTPPASFFVWTPAPAGLGSMECAKRMLEAQSVVAIPGSGFGAEGEGYVRFSLTAADDRLEEAAARLGRISW
jgi:LL-diaminopimelate aminotransferase